MANSSKQFDTAMFGAARYRSRGTTVSSSDMAAADN